MQRRNFLSTVALSGTAALLHSPARALAAKKVSLTKGDVILFQGDSITDAGREKKNPTANKGLGRGYPNVLATSLRKDYADLDLQIHNRGISGNKVPDLDRRWDRDCIQLKPQLLSILIGVNDIWHMLNGRYKGTAESYRDGYAALLERTKKALPETTLVVCEPFVLMSGTAFAEDRRRMADIRIYDRVYGRCRCQQRRQFGGIFNRHLPVQCPPHDQHGHTDLANHGIKITGNVLAEACQLCRTIAFTQ